MDLDDIIYEIDKRYCKIKDLEDEIISFKKKLTIYQTKHCKIKKRNECLFDGFEDRLDCYRCFGIEERE